MLDVLSIDKLIAVVNLVVKKYNSIVTPDGERFKVHIIPYLLKLIDR